MTNDLPRAAASDALPERSIKRVIYTHEAWYASSLAHLRSPNTVEEWSIGVDARTVDGRHDGTHGEVSLIWMTLGREVVWNFQAFGDGLPIVVQAGLVDLLIEHAESDRVTLREALAEAGWVDCTDRNGPAKPSSVESTLEPPTVGTPQ